MSLLARVQERARGPIGAHLQLVDRCNHKCAHCYQVQGCKGELDTATWKLIMDRLAAAGVLLLNVTGGEATLRPDLIELLEHARSRSFAVRLFTNGFLVDDKLADALAKLNLLSVEISVYSDVASEHDALTGIRGSWEHATAAIRRLVARGVSCSLKWTATKLSTAGRERMQALADELGADLFGAGTISAREDGSTGAVEALMLDEAELVRFFAEHPRPEGADEREEHPCRSCRNALLIGPDGLVRPCTAIPTILGDARADDPKSVAASEQARRIANIRWTDLRGCSECELVPWCPRCHGDALAEAGDLLGPYPSGCRAARAWYAASHGLSEVRVNGESSRGTGPYAIESRGALVAKKLELRDNVPGVRDADSRLVQLRVTRGSRVG